MSRSVVNFKSAWEELDKRKSPSPAVQKLRSSLGERSWPDRSAEDFKYTSFSKILGVDFSLAPKEQFTVPNDPDFHQILIVNDTVVSSVISDPGIKILEMSDDFSLFQKTESEKIKSGRSDNFLVSLNRAMGGVSNLIEITGQVKKPVLITYIRVGTQSEMTVQTRVSVNMKKFAEVEILEHFYSLDSGGGFFNRLFEAKLEEGSQLKHYRLQDDSKSALFFGSCLADVEKDARYLAWNFNLGGKVARDFTSVRLTEVGAYTGLSGLYLTDGQRQHDQHIEVHHDSKLTSSHQLYKGILKDSSRGVFNGRIFVAKDASQVDARQLNNNLLLSSEAEIDTKPELSIDNDDVKCSHGATVGQLNADQIFYLNSRGISPKEAEQILAKAFIDEIVFSVSDGPVRRKMTQSLSAHIGGRG